MDDRKPSAFADLVSGACWLALAAAIMIGAWRMDRLEHLQASIYSAPGIVPGLIGVALAFMGLVLMLRAWWAGALAGAGRPRIAWSEQARLLTAVGLCLAFAIGLVGRGPPFWLAAAIFIAVTVFAFQFPERRSAGTLARGTLIAVVYGLVSGYAVHYVFQELFLVRLP
jgi:hypothetical protein